MMNRIEQSLDDLSRAKKRVAQWILAHPREAIGATLAEVSAECGSSEPTVVRFCRSVGLSGFRELGTRLTESLIDIRSQLSAMPIDATVAVMAAARQIAFAGLGASGHVARDACHKFFRLGIPCTSLTDTPMILQFAAIAEASDVLVLLSHTGRWSEFVHAANLALSSGERAADKLRKSKEALLNAAS